MYQKKSKTIQETALERVPKFGILVDKLTKSFSINGKARSTLSNYLRCLSHIAIHYKCSPEHLTKEQINDYLFYCQKLHKTPSESFLNIPFMDFEPLIRFFWEWRENGFNYRIFTKEFIRRFQLHILPKGFTRIRHYGFLSSSWKKEKLPLLQLQLADKNLTHIEIFVPQEESLHGCCPSCKKQPSFKK
ncbi:MAG: hypothetical protein ACJAX3_002703 [Patiriisocius sp.]|jgi:hypothetical protein